MAAAALLGAASANAMLPSTSALAAGSKMQGLKLVSYERPAAVQVRMSAEGSCSTATDSGCKMGPYPSRRAALLAISTAALTLAASQRAAEASSRGEGRRLAKEKVEKLKEESIAAKEENETAPSPVKEAPPPPAEAASPPPAEAAPPPPAEAASPAPVKEVEPSPVTVTEAAPQPVTEVVEIEQVEPPTVEEEAVIPVVAEQAEIAAPRPSPNPPVLDLRALMEKAKEASAEGITGKFSIEKD